MCVWGDYICVCLYVPIGIHCIFLYCNIRGGRMRRAWDRAVISCCCWSLSEDVMACDTPSSFGQYLATGHGYQGLCIFNTTSFILNYSFPNKWQQRTTHQWCHHTPTPYFLVIAKQIILALQRSIYIYTDKYNITTQFIVLDTKKIIIIKIESW